MILRAADATIRRGIEDTMKELIPYINLNPYSPITNHVPDFQDVVNFHGHSCPGLIIGYRVSIIALRILLADRSGDEELVVIVENDTCSVDAIQYVCGCTFGKGNLIFWDYGKYAYSFYNRMTGEGIRIYLKSAFWYQTNDRQRIVERIMREHDNYLFSFSLPRESIPKPARIRQSVLCNVCGERVMETRIQKYNTIQMCWQCALQQKNYAA